jgi:hypothetical protein
MIANRWYFSGRCMYWMAVAIALLPRITFAGDDLQSQAQAHLEEVRRLEEVAAQKTENDVWMALRQSQRLAATDPAQAIDALRTLLATLDQDPYLSPARRDSLTQKIKVRIRQIERAAKKSSPASQTATASQPSTPAQPAATSPRRRLLAEDPTALHTALQEVNAMIKAGQTAEAKSRLADLEQRYPDNPAIAASRRLIFNNEVTRTSRGIQQEADARTGAQILEMTRSSTPPASDYELPKDWAEKTKKRSAIMQLTDKERSILAGLNKTVTIQVQNAKFEDVIQQISDQIHQPILLDKAAVAEAQISYDTTISDQLPGVSARTALRKILGEFGLTYVIKDQAVQVTSTQKARDLMIVRSYYVGDLLGNGGIGGPLALATTPVSQLQVAQQVKQLIDMIQASIDPMSWKESGGLGVITFHGPASSLVIKQSAEVHAMLAEGGLRP